MCDAPQKEMDFMSRNFLSTVLALAALLVAGVAPSAVPTLSTHAIAQAAKGPGGDGGGGNPYPPCDECVVRAL